MKVEIEFTRIETQQQEDYLHYLLDELVDRMNRLGLKVITYTKPKLR